MIYVRWNCSLIFLARLCFERLNIRCDTKSTKICGCHKSYSEKFRRFLVLWKGLTGDQGVARTPPWTKGTVEHAAIVQTSKNS